MTQPTTRIEDVWAAKGNLPDNAIVATADGKYPALDGSLITSVVKPATFTLEPKRSTSLTFADLGFVAEMSENAGKDGLNGFTFDSAVSDYTNEFGTCHIGVWGATAPELSGYANAAASYYWMPNTGGAATDLRYYDRVANDLTPHQESFSFLSPSQSFAIRNGATFLSQQQRGDYVIDQGFTNFVEVAELDLTAGVTYELDYDILAFYAQGGPAFNPEFVLADASAGMALQISIQAINDTTMIDDNVTVQYSRSGWTTRSWDVDAASNWNSTYTQFNTIGSELGYANGASYSTRYSVKATLTCTETTTCDLRYYNASGASTSVIDLLSFRLRAV
jgi:hypothetical protein